MPGLPARSSGFPRSLFSLRVLGQIVVVLRAPLGHAGFWSAYLRYSIVGLVVAGLTAGVLVLRVDAIGLHPTFGQALALLIVTPVAFVLFKRWTFRS